MRSSKWYGAILASCLLLTTPGYAFEGLSTFSSMSPKFPCKKVLNYLDKLPHPAMNALWGTFGEDLSCLAKFTARNQHREHLIQIILSNESCRFFNRCKKGELARGLGVKSYNARLANGDLQLADEIRFRVREIREAAEAIATSKTTLVLSIGLEDRLSNLAANNLVTIIKTEWPYDLVRNSLSSTIGVDPRVSYMESHGLRPDCSARTIANNDGNVLSPASAKQYRKRTRDCGVVFFWLPRLQGISSQKFVRPRKRHFRFDSGDVLLADRFFK